MADVSTADVSTAVFKRVAQKDTGDTARQKLSQFTYKHMHTLGMDNVKREVKHIHKICTTHARLLKTR